MTQILLKYQRSNAYVDEKALEEEEGLMTYPLSSSTTKLFTNF